MPWPWQRSARSACSSCAAAAASATIRWRASPPRMPRRPRGCSSTSSSTSIRTFSRTAMTDFAATIREHVRQSRETETRFLAELVKVPSDNPPGDCRAHAERAAALLEGLGFTVERHPVPPETVAAAGMIPATHPVVRRKFGPTETEGGPVLALHDPGHYNGGDQCRVKVSETE